MEKKCRMIECNDKYLSFGHLHCNRYRAKLGEKIIPFKANGVNKNGKFITWDITKNFKANKWTVLFFYPADFTFVCPTEIRGFSELASEFEKNNAEVVAGSVDSPIVHLNWRNSSLGKVKLTMISDQNHLISRYFRIYSHEKGVAWRGTFIISPKGVLYVNYSTFEETGRSAKEALRLLQAAQLSEAGKLVPCEWKPGKKTL